MSQLEEKVKAFISPLAIGVACDRFDLDARLLKATWAVKTIMVAETTTQEQIFFSKGECEYLRLHSMPPVGVSVAVAALQSKQGPLFAGFSHINARGLAGESADISTYTLQIGTLIFIVHRFDPPTFNEHTLNFEGRRLVDQIYFWPPTVGASWPPLKVLDDEAFMNHRLGPGGLSLPQI
jgi:hypothetical protein